MVVMGIDAEKTVSRGVVKGKLEGYVVVVNSIQRRD